MENVSPFLSSFQISDIHQFYTRNMEVHTMDDMDFIMSSISASGANESSWRRSRTAIIPLLILATVIGRISYSLISH